MIDLSVFCSKNEPSTRNFLLAPFRHGAFAYASNGHIAIRVPVNGYLDAPEYPNAVKIYAKFNEPDNCALTLPPVPAPIKCGTCNGAGIVYKSECEDCDGDGWFHYGNHEYDCKECNATGLVAADRETAEKRVCDECRGTGEEYGNPTAITDAIDVQARYLRLVSGLPNPMIVFVRDESEPVLIRFDGGIVAIMPFRKR